MFSGPVAPVVPVSTPPKQNPQLSNKTLSVPNLFQLAPNLVNIQNSNNNRTLVPPPVPPTNLIPVAPPPLPITQNQYSSVNINSNTKSPSHIYSAPIANVHLVGGMCFFKYSFALEIH